MNRFRDVIDAWPSPAELAGDIGEKLYNVQKWRVRDSIPAKNWDAIVSAAKKRGYRVTLAMLSSFALLKAMEKSKKKAA